MHVKSLIGVFFLLANEAGPDGTATFDGQQIFDDEVGFK